jgi:pSer/pThr/pTyr-binding forkhead associated (FHA) protein
VARLQILSGKRQGDFLELEAGTHRIGTGRAEIQLRDKEIAYKHANVIVEAKGLYIEDLGSGKGVTLNGHRLPEKEKAQVRPKDKIVVGGTELLVVEDGVVPAAGDGGDPRKVSGTTAQEIVVMFDEDEAGNLSEIAAPGPAPPAADTAALEAELRELRTKLSRREQENAALEKAVSDYHREDETSADTAFVPADLQEDLEGSNVELREQADRYQAEVLELKTGAREREDAHGQALRKLEDQLAAEKKKRSAVEREVQRLLEAREDATGDDKRRAEELKTFEDLNAQLVIENDELKERVEALRYQIEQEAARRGELVRVRVLELATENKHVLEKSAEQRTLVEAYEEKIDELDERLEELEGENEELERLLDEVRAELAKVKQERETMQKTQRQKIQRLEERVDELEAEKIRLRAQSDRALALGHADGAGGKLEDADALRAKVARLEALLDDAEIVQSARDLEARSQELEVELAGLRARLEAVPRGDETAQAVADSRAKVEELAKRNRLDERKIERLERKNRELVRANIAAEMAAQVAAAQASAETTKNPSRA